MKSPRYKIYKDKKTNKFFIKSRIKVLFIPFYVNIIELVECADGWGWPEYEKKVLYFDSTKHCHTYIREVLEKQQNPFFELVEKVYDV